MKTASGTSSIAVERKGQARNALEFAYVSLVGFKDSKGGIMKRPWVLCMILMICSACILVFNSAHQPIQVLLANEVLPAQEEARLTRLNSRPHHKNWFNLLVKDSQTYTSTILEVLKLNNSDNSPCHTWVTNSTRLEGLPEPSSEGKFVFRTDVLHRLTLVAIGEDGPRCAGGDYFEVDFHDRGNKFYRSRLPTVDFGNGSYGLELVVPSRFAGSFSVEIWLLFGNYHGLDRKTEAWMRDILVWTQELEMVTDLEYEKQRNHPGSALAEVELELKPGNGDRAVSRNLKRCTKADFDRVSWQGRWTRSWYNDSCEADNEKRFRCLPEEHSQCEEPWCFGPLDRLESNGWEYSAHCGFKIFSREEAWDCLSGKWILLWGDSNFQDTMRNLLVFILGWDLPDGKKLSSFQLTRDYEAAFLNQRRYDQELRVSMHFNGANSPWLYGVGLNTVQFEFHQQKILAHFNGTRWPDMVFMNSGLHDGDNFDTVEDYAASADKAVQWWIELYRSIPGDRKPQLVWRTTVAPAGISRRMNGNPNKMEMFNHIIVEKLQQVSDKMPVKFIDTFDLTFPFHYGNDYSDGGHYGRAPGANLKPWRGKPHWYFVDIMLGHAFLNAVCPST